MKADSLEILHSRDVSEANHTAHSPPLNLIFISSFFAPDPVGPRRLTAVAHQTMTLSEF